MGRPQLVSDEDIRNVTITLLCEGVSPSVELIRKHLKEKHNAGGDPGRVARISTEVIKALGYTLRAPLAHPDIPKALLEEAGNLLARMFALSQEGAKHLFEAERDEIRRAAAEAVGKIEKAAAAVARTNETLKGQLAAAREQIGGLEASQAGLLLRNEQLAADLAAANVTLQAEREVRAAETETSKNRIRELEEALKAKPAIDRDDLVKLLAQATKGKKDS